MSTALNLRPADEPAAPLIDIAGLTGDEDKLVRACFEHYTVAAQAITADLMGFDVPIQRARQIIISSLLTIAGVDAHEQQIGTVEFGDMARHARRLAAEAVSVGIDVEGGAQ